MRKIDIAQEIAAKADVPISDGIRLVELVLGMMIETLRRGESVMIAGFGKFSVRQKQARKGRNPWTGKTIPITPRRVIQFRASQLMKTAVAGAPDLVAFKFRRLSFAAKTPPHVS